MVETLEGVKLAARAPRMEMMSTDEDSKAEYLYVDVKAPVLAGFPLKCFAWLLETGLAGSFLLPKLKKDNLITKVIQKYNHHLIDKNLFL